MEREEEDNASEDDNQANESSEDHVSSEDEKMNEKDDNTSSLIPPAESLEHPAVTVLQENKPPEVAPQPDNSEITTKIDNESIQMEWSEHTAPDGSQYYYETKTKTSSWIKPVNVVLVELAAPKLIPVKSEKIGLSDWRKIMTNFGASYYFNITTKEALWEMPTELKYSMVPEDVIDPFSFQYKKMEVELEAEKKKT